MSWLTKSDLWLGWQVIKSSIVMLFQGLFWPRSDANVIPLRRQDVVRFIPKSCREVRAMINLARPRTSHGSLDWLREEYIAYALARPVNRELDCDDETARQWRFRRHEMFANDNIDYDLLARILWYGRLVSVNGLTCKEELMIDSMRSQHGWGYSYPKALRNYIEGLAPWLPKPPDEPNSAVA